MAEIIARIGDELTIQVTMKLSGSFMEMENTILDGCNEIGCLATTEALQKFGKNWLINVRRWLTRREAC